MPTLTISCKIDQRVIDKYTKEQRALGERITLSDEVCAGLKLVINNQSASWTYAYRKRGRRDGGKRHPQRTMKLGDPVAMSAPEARLAAEQVKAQVRAGGDPAIEKRKSASLRRAQEARKLTCSAWLERYHAEQMSDGSTKYQRDEVRNIRMALGELGLSDCYPEEVTPRHIRELADMHRDRPATGRQRFGALSRFLDHLLDEEAIAANPAASVSKKRRPKPPAPRMNFFSPEQLAQLWHAEGLKPGYKRYLRFMISTPLRAAEGANLRWSQIDRQRGEVILEASGVKNSEHFVMPLNALALFVIGEPREHRDDLVFDLSARSGSPMTAWSHFGKQVRFASGLERFILHDLRRTFSTLMAEHTDVSETLIDSLLNHKQSATRGGVIRHYQQAKHIEARRDVMAIWGRLMKKWIEVNPSEARTSLG